MSKRLGRWLAVLVLAAVLLGLMWFLTIRGYEVRFMPEPFFQSNRQLNNPDRGFYSIQAYTIRDYPQTFQPEETDWPLELVQINLRLFRFGEISQVGMQNVKDLFACLRSLNKRFLIRFLYDWNGTALLTEPDRLDIILTHMRQLSPVLKEYDDCIFVLQGLFVGNWGEMNGTSFVTREGLEQLSRELIQGAGEGAFLAVRTPAQWRNAVGSAVIDWSDPLACRLGLFNDGMLGDLSDCGTYNVSEEAGSDPFTVWSREQELSFQQELCCRVPNGGEVIYDNDLNDFSSALEAFRTMHVTYLNWDYDREVLDKWAGTTVEEEPFQGMDGLTYMERHLGYRYYIQEALMEYDFFSNRLLLGAKLKNAGFAPCYSEKKLVLTLLGKMEKHVIPLTADLRDLTGGNRREDTLAAQACIPLTDLGETEYRVYLKTPGLELANHQQPGNYGIYLGQLSFRHPGWYEQAARWLPK